MMDLRGHKDCSVNSFIVAIHRRLHDLRSKVNVERARNQLPSIRDPPESDFDDAVHLYPRALSFIFPVLQKMPFLSFNFFIFFQIEMDFRLFASFLTPT